MKKIKFLCFILALISIICAFSACSKFKYDNSTIYAKVSAIDGQKVTLLVGEMSFDGNMFNGNFEGGERPDMGSFPDMENGEIPSYPEDGSLPSGAFSDGQIPEGAFPNGSMPDMGELPSMPEGGGQMPNENFPEGMGNMQLPFTETGDSITLTLDEDTVKTLSVGSIVQITFGEGGSVLSLNNINNMMSNFGGGLGNMAPPTGGTNNFDS